MEGSLRQRWQDPNALSDADVVETAFQRLKMRAYDQLNSEDGIRSFCHEVMSIARYGRRPPENIVSEEFSWNLRSEIVENQHRFWVTFKKLSTEADAIDVTGVGRSFGEALLEAARGFIMEERRLAAKSSVPEE